MNFDLSKEQEMIRKLIRDFAEAEVAPGADDRDRTGEFPKESFFKISRVRDYGSAFPGTIRGR